MESDSQVAKTDPPRAMSDSRFAIAADWLLRLQANSASEEDFADWLAWREADPANRAAFEEAQDAFEAAHGLPQEERARWAHELMAGERPASDRSRTTRPCDNWWRRQRLRFDAVPRSVRAGALSLTFVAALIVAISTVRWLFSAPQAEITATFQTARARHRVEKLPDGSEVRLGAQSSISLNFSKDTRFLVLEAGEAYFAVAKDARPFVVQAGSVAVRAVGTQFNVRRAAERTYVAVSEGTVEVTEEATGQAPGGLVAGAADASARPRAIRVQAGEQVAADTRTTAMAVEPVTRTAIGAWQKGRLQFSNEPLRLVVATVNRYSERQIVVTHQALRDLSVTGTVTENHIEEWLRALPEVLPVKVIEIGKETVLISPAS